MSVVSLFPGRIAPRGVDSLPWAQETQDLFLITIPLKSLRFCGFVQVSRYGQVTCCNACGYRPVTRCGVILASGDAAQKEFVQLHRCFFTSVGVLTPIAASRMLGRHFA